MFSIIPRKDVVALNAAVEELQKETKALIARHKEALAFMRDCAKDFDCDTGCNGTHPADCRKCRAEKFLKIYE